MLLTALILSALLLSLERLTYYAVANHPERWHAACQRPPLAALGSPVDVVHKLFYLFKMVQAGVFLGWCMVMTGNWLPAPTADPVMAGAGIALMGLGLVLNASVFARLGRVGVFYGSQLGHHVPWVQGFPFSLLKHPQYMGALALIWGFFLLMRYPYPDWFYLPLLETALYLWGTHHEP
ncbi:methyltransferase [Halomonadaceae bacterium KBTZ08]